MWNGCLKIGKRRQRRRKVGFILIRKLFLFLENENNKEQSKIGRRNAKKKAITPFIDFEAEQSGEECGNSDLEDDESSLDRDFINDSEIEEDDELPSNPYMTGFFERTGSTSPQPDEPVSTCLTKAQFLQQVWEKADAQLIAAGVIKSPEEKAREEEEKKRKLAEEEDRKKKRVERRNKREVATYVYAHYGQKYDNVSKNFEFNINF